MARKLTITERLAKPHVLQTNLEVQYREMAADEEREREAQEWVEALAPDAVSELR